MIRLEDIKQGVALKGILPDGLVTVIDVKLVGPAVELTYKDGAGRLGNELLYREREAALDIVAAGCVNSGFAGLFRKNVSLQISYYS